jgi:hypothetical protein
LRFLTSASLVTPLAVDILHAGFSHLIVLAIVSIPLKSDKHDLAENCLTLTTNTNTFPCLSHWQFQNVSYSTLMVIHILVGASRYQFLFKQIWYSTFILSKPSKFEFCSWWGVLDTTLCDKSLSSPRHFCGERVVRSLVFCVAFL